LVRSSSRVADNVKTLSFYKTRHFIIRLTKDRHWIVLSQLNPNHTIKIYFLRSILIVSSHLHTHTLPKRTDMFETYHKFIVRVLITIKLDKLKFFVSWLSYLTCIMDKSIVIKSIFRGLLATFIKLYIEICLLDRGVLQLHKVNL
jgi:hypothetical protein